MFLKCFWLEIMLDECNRLTRTQENAKEVTRSFSNKSIRIAYDFFTLFLKEIIKQTCIFQNYNEQSQKEVKLYNAFFPFPCWTTLFILPFLGTSTPVLAVQHHSLPSLSIYQPYVL